MSGIPTITYGVEGEGRPSTVSAATGQNPVSATSYNPASQVTGVTFGSGDSDALTFDPNTGRMTQYQFNVNGQSQVGALGWNANSTLQTLAITVRLSNLPRSLLPMTISARRFGVNHRWAKSLLPGGWPTFTFFVKVGIHAAEVRDFDSDPRRRLGLATFTLF